MMGSWQMRDAALFQRSRPGTLRWQLGCHRDPAAVGLGSHGHRLRPGPQGAFASLYEVFPWSTWTMAAVMNNFVGDGNGYVGNLALAPDLSLRR